MNFKDVEFNRNLGFISNSEQQRLNESTVAVAGAGGDGGAIAVQLARMGVGAIRLADPESFEPENINRQVRATTATVGHNKAETVGDYVSEINKKIEVKVYSQGVTSENLNEFVEGANLVIDESDFTLHAIGVALARKAREKNIPNLMAMNIGFGATVTTFHPKGKTLESFLGLSEQATLEELEQEEVPISKWLPYIPAYGDVEVLKKVASGKKPAPSIAPGVSLAAAMGVSQSFLNLVNGLENHRTKPIYAPRLLAMDALTGESRLIKHPSVAFVLHLGRMYVRNALNLNPKTNY